MVISAGVTLMVMVPPFGEQCTAFFNRFLRQVVIQRGLPFDVKLPVRKPLALGAMTKDELDRELQKGMDDIAAGRTKSAEEVEKEMRELYHI